MSAVIQNEYTGNGSTTTYSFTFPYLKTSDIKASLDGVDTTAFTLPNATTLQFNTAPTNGAKIKIFRQTSVDNLTATFYAGSAIKSEDLNDNFTQNLYKTQEIGGRFISALGGTMTGDLNMGEDTAIKFEGATDDAHETTLTVADPTADRTITLPNVTGTVVTTGDTGTVATGMIAADAVTGAKIADDQINSEHYVDGSIDTAHIADAQVTTAKIADSNVTTGKLAADAVTAAKLADNAVVTANIVDDAVTTQKIAADSIVGSRIADNSIDSEHYVNGSIDNAHLANNSVTLAKMADDSVGTAELVDGSVDTARLADNSVTLAKMTDNSVGTSELVNNAVTTGKIADNAITMAKLSSGTLPTDITVASANLVDGTIATADIADNAVTTGKIQDGELKTLAGMQSGTASKLASGQTLTADINDLNQIDGLTKQTTISDSDASFPTSGAVVDYVAAQLAPLGGFEAIANEQSFPNTQPASGVVISIADAGGLVVSNSGTASGQTVGGTTVNITGIASNFNGTTVSNGVRFLVASTGSGQNYTYHKATLNEDDLVSLSGDINDFAERYRVGSSNPTTALDNGDLFFNTSTGKMLVYNGTNTAWEEVQSIGNFFISTLSPAFDGSTQNFTITNAPTNAEQVLLVINGVVQKPNSGTSAPSEGFALDGNTIKLGAAPATGSTYHAVVIGSTVNIGTPSNNTVSTAIIQNGAVTTAKIADDAVTAAKIADGAIDNSAKIGGSIINNTHMADNAINTAEIVDDAVTAAKIADNAINSDRLSNSAVSSAKLATNSVTTVKIADGNVTTGKIANEAITLAKLEHGTSSNNGKFLRANNGADPTFETVNTDLSADQTPQLGGDLDVNGNDILLGDNGELRVGAGNDLRLYHYQNNNWLNVESGNLILGRAGYSKITFDGNGNLGFNDSVKSYFGDSGDLEIYHDGHNRIRCTQTGQDLYVAAEEGEVYIQTDFGNSNAIACRDNGSVELYYNGVERVTTKDNGAQITGSLEIEGGTVNGNHDATLYVTAAGNNDWGLIVDYGTGSSGKSEYGAKIVSRTGSSHAFSIAQVSGGSHAEAFLIDGDGNVDKSGHIYPRGNNSFDLGSTSYRWRNIYTGDLHLSNKGSSNEVDGSWGDWTIQEGESDLFLKNNRSGKKYKFNLTEVS